MSEIPEDILPVGYVTKNELTKLRLGASCVDLFGQVVPKGFEMVPLYSAPVSLSSELDRLREENKTLREAAWRLMIAANDVDLGRSIHNSRKPDDVIEGPVWVILREASAEVRASLSPDNSTQKKEGEI